MPSPAETIAALRALATGHGELVEVFDTVLTPENESWANDIYLVEAGRDGDGFVRQLCIRRRDNKPARDWRDFMRIKNEIAGEECEAVELFPAMSRLVDTSNRSWLWCLPPDLEFSFGFTQRAVFDVAEIPGSAQRALDGFADSGIGDASCV
jgi:hypothetical protein